MALEKLPSVEDRGQTDRVITPTRAELRRCRWSQMRYVYVWRHRRDISFTLRRRN